MTIGSIGASSFIPPNQAATERLKELAAPAPFRRPDIAQLPKPDGRMQPRQLVPSYQKSTAIRKLLQDANGGSPDVSEQLSALEDHLRSGGRLSVLLKAGDSLQSSLLYILATELADRAKSADSAFASYVESEVVALLASKGEEINAAINSAKAFSTSSAPPAERRWLRAGYLGVVSAQGSISDLLESLLIRFGPSGFQSGALVLLKGINDDLTSASPSIRPGKLHLLLLSSLVSLRHLTAFIRATLAFVKQFKAPDFPDRAIREDREEYSVPVSRLKDDSSKENSGGSQDNPNHNELNEASEEDALTVKTVLQLISGQGSIKLLQRYLEDHFGQDLGRRHKEQVFREFVAFIQDLPLALWRERSHKDKLIDALRKQLLLDQLDRSSTS